MGIYTAILFSHKKEWNCAIWRDKDGHRDCIQSEVSQKKEKKILFVTHMWNLEKKHGTDGVICKVQTETQK